MRRPCHSSITAVGCTGPKSRSYCSFLGRIVLNCPNLVIFHGFYGDDLTDAPSDLTDGGFDLTDGVAGFGLRVSGFRFQVSGYRFSFHQKCLDGFLYSQITT